MRRIARLAAPGAVFLLAGMAWPASPVPALVPVDDPLATTPLLPAGISQNQPECSGQYAHVWEQTDGSQVIQYYGDFSLHLGQRRLRSREAVIWMRKSLWRSTLYYFFEAYLYQEAEVRENAGTMTTGPALFVTFSSLLPPVIEADVHTGRAAQDTPLYQEAAKVRTSLGAQAPARPPDGLRTTVPGQALRPRPKPRPLVQHTAREQVYNELQGIITAIGDVYVSQGTDDPGEFLEIRADAAVLFVAQRPEPVTQQRPKNGAATQPFPTEAGPRPQAAESASFGGGTLEGQVTGAYLRGSVVLTRGERMIRASEIYYDFENDRALMLDAVMRTVLPEREVPLYVRAREVRQLSTAEFFAREANVSASEFHTPHVSLGAERIFLTDTTPRDPSGRVTGLLSGRYRAYDATLNVDGVPIAYWPYSQGDLQQAQNLVQSVRFAYSDDFGATFESKWYLFSLLGMEKPKGVDGILRLDYFSERGPGVGIDLNYEQPDYYGMFRGYYIHDQGSDNLGPYRGGPPDTENRGRLTIRHRQFLPGKIELTVEASWISDPNFLEEYFRREFETQKEQETLLYLKKQQDNWAITTLAQWRVIDFLTQTEHLPDAGFNWIGEPLLGGIANFYNDSRIGLVRYRPDDRLVYDKGTDGYRSRVVFRGDTRNEIDVPIKLGDVNLVPFAMGRSSVWDDSPLEGGLDRQFGMIGGRLGTQFWRVFPDAESRVLDVNGVRHVIRPQATAWMSATNTDSRDLYPFDQYVENINDFYGTSVALRNSWQTKRGGPGQWRNVDWMKFDLELNLFGNQPRQPLFWSHYHTLPIGRYYDSRPEDSIARNHIKADYMYRISDTTAVLSDANVDLNDGSLDLFNISYAVERTPRSSYFAGYRYIGPTDSHLIGGGFNYLLNEKHTVGLRAYYDLDRGELEQLDLAVIRKFPRFNAGLTFGLNNIEEDFNVGVSLWPEGAPGTAIGSRQFTALSEGTGIRADD